MTDTQEIEQEEIDTTAEKAKAIGKELGVVEDAVPEYDIQEEPDEKIAKERTPAATVSARKKLTAKEKRDLHRSKVNNLINGKDAEIQRLRDENENFKRWQTDVNGRLAGINRAEVDKALGDAVAVFNKAKQDNAEAFAQGDGAKHIETLQTWAAANDRIKQLQGIKQQLERQPVQQQVQQNSSVDAALVNKAKSWAERNPWYKATDGSHVDSEIAKAISGVLANEGYDPTGDDFWDELDDRLAERKIGSSDDEYREEEEQAPIRPLSKKRSSPPLAGGSPRGDVVKKTVTLPTSYIKMLKDNGIWNDIPRRNKIIADRERILRESDN